jgi:hypothetical protein
MKAKIYKIINNNLINKRKNPKATQAQPINTIEIFHKLKMNNKLF